MTIKTSIIAQLKKNQGKLPLVFKQKQYYTKFVLYIFLYNYVTEQIINKKTCEIKSYCFKFLINFNKKQNVT